MMGIHVMKNNWVDSRKCNQYTVIIFVQENVYS